MTTALILQEQQHCAGIPPDNRIVCSISSRISGVAMRSLKRSTLSNRFVTLVISRAQKMLQKQEGNLDTLVNLSGYQGLLPDKLLCGLSCWKHSKTLETAALGYCISWLQVPKPKWLCLQYFHWWCIAGWKQRRKEKNWPLNMLLACCQVIHLKVNSQQTNRCC